MVRLADGPPARAAGVPGFGPVPARGMKTAKCFARIPRTRRAKLMKLVTAIIKPFKLDDVRAALSDIGVSA